MFCRFLRILKSFGFKRADDPSSPRKYIVFQSSHTVTSGGVVSPQDENTPHPDQNDLTVLQADDLSAEIQYLENLTQEYEKTEKRRRPISSEKLQNVTQGLFWDIYRTEKFDEVMEEIFPP